MKINWRVFTVCFAICLVLAAINEIWPLPLWKYGVYGGALGVATQFTPWPLWSDK